MSANINRRRLFGGTAAVLGGAALSASAATGASAWPGRRGRRVKTGVEVLAKDDFAELSGQAVGVISNPTGIMPDLGHEVDLMHGSGAVDIVAVFGPEHGFRGTSQAGEGEDYFLDPKTGIPVYNAYNNKDRMAELLAEAGVGTIAFDIQDVGSASTPTSGRCTWRWRPPPTSACASSSSTGPTRSRAGPLRDRCCTPSTPRSWASSRSPSATA
ncbi:hypothetical protein GCM10029992_33760 [Glycomyces albus]